MCGIISVEPSDLLDPSSPVWPAQTRLAQVYSRAVTWTAKSGQGLELSRSQAAKNSSTRAPLAAGSLFWPYRLDPLHLESNHAKFQLNPLRNGWDIGHRVFKDSAALHGILQCCRVTVMTLWTWSFPPKEQSCKISAESVKYLKSI